MELFDTHAHLDFPDFKEDLDEVVARSRDNGVCWILNVGTDIESSSRSVQIARDYERVYATVGVHPHDAKTMADNSLRALKLLAAEQKVVAVGEIGLDYYRDHSPREKQKEVFRLQISLARELKRPIVVHDREAHDDVYAIIKEERAAEVGGVMHCFPGDWEMAKKFINEDFYVSIGGPVTFKNASLLQDVAKKVPQDRLLLETDCPFLTPEPKRGRRNEPAYLRYTAEFVSELRGIPVEELAYWTTNNAMQLFKIS